MTDEEAKKRLAELKQMENRPVDKKTIERLWELRCQVYRVKDCEQKLQETQNKKPNFGKDVTKNMDAYNSRKNGLGSSVFVILSFLLSIAVVAGYVIFCVQDAKNGWNVFYPVEEGFTLTYLFKVIFIGLLGGAVAVLLIFLLGWLLDTLMEKIRYATYDSRHAKELKEAQEADALLLREAEEKFQTKKQEQIKQLQGELEEAKAYVDAFTEVPDEIKTEEIIDPFYENMELVMGDGVPFDLALHAFMGLYQAEKMADLYYYSAFPRKTVYNEKEHKKLMVSFGKEMDRFSNKLTKDQLAVFLGKDPDIWEPIYKAVAVGKIRIQLERVRSIKTKKEANAFFEETIRVHAIAERMIKRLTKKD
ncbi:MAG: hypothetical protein IJV80_00675 [Clostridia bacterium]|nr:hypothetical protein [Clostridia bacterium]